MRHSPTYFILILQCLFIISCTNNNETDDATRHTLFRIGFKGDNYNTGPLINSAFLLQLKDTIHLLITAHHVASYINGGKYYQWNQLKDKATNLFLWSVEDTAYSIKPGLNLPIKGAKVLHLDMAAFHMPDRKDLTYLKPSAADVKLGDTIQLFSKLLFYDTATILHPAKVIYVTGSILVYEFLIHKTFNLSGTSGAPTTNLKHEVISSSYGGFSLPDISAKEKLSKNFPLINKLPVEIGRTYGIGIPISLVTKSLSDAIAKEESLR